jgi:hypothetical protein
MPAARAAFECRPVLPGRMDDTARGPGSRFRAGAAGPPVRRIGQSCPGRETAAEPPAAASRDAS